MGFIISGASQCRHNSCLLVWPLGSADTGASYQLFLKTLQLSTVTLDTIFHRTQNRDHDNLPGTVGRSAEEVMSEIMIL